MHPAPETRGALRAGAPPYRGNDPLTVGRRRPPSVRPEGPGGAAATGGGTMPPTIPPARYTAEIEGDFVVFLIGMRLNRPWKVHQWLPVFTGMQRMLRELARHPEHGLLGAPTRLPFGGAAGGGD